MAGTTRREVNLNAVPKGGEFFMSKKARIVYISFGFGKESFLDMSGPSWMPYIEYAPLRDLKKVTRVYTYPDVWIDE